MIDSFIIANTFWLVWLFDFCRNWAQIFILSLVKGVTTQRFFFFRIFESSTKLTNNQKSDFFCCWVQKFKNGLTCREKNCIHCAGISVGYRKCFKIFRQEQLLSLKLPRCRNISSARTTKSEVNQDQQNTAKVHLFKVILSYLSTHTSIGEEKDYVDAKLICQ